MDLNAMKCQETEKMHSENFITGKPHRILLDVSNQE